MREKAANWLVPALGMMFGLQSLRVLFPSFVGYLRDSRGVDPVGLAPIALGIFGLSFLAGLLRRAAGPARARWLTVGGLGLARLAEQLSRSPAADLLLSGLGVVLFLLYLPNALGVSQERRRTLAQALILGMSADTALHVGAMTLDLSWRPGWFPALLVALLAGLLGAALYASRGAEGVEGEALDWGAALPLAALGPWLFLQMLAFQNVARVSALVGWETPAAGALVLLGNGLGLAAGAARLRRRWVVVNGLLLVFVFLNPEPTGFTAALMLLAGQIVSAALGILILERPGQGGSRGRVVAAHGLGQMLLVLLVFLYYVVYDLDLGFRAPVLLPVGALLVALGAALVPGEPTPENWRFELRPAGLALLLLISPLGLALVWAHPEPVTPNPNNGAVRVMDYNLHNGFSTDGRLDMEALARVIEESGAEVVGLQEVSRGWLIWGGLDMLSWLSQRLEMGYVSGPTADAQWGNALLSRYPIVESRTRSLPTEELLIRRGMIQAQIDIGRGQLMVINTHFAHTAASAPERALQAQALLASWRGAGSTVVMGDMNATPDSEAMGYFLEAGFVNVAAESCPTPVLTSPAEAPTRQIDYIWASPDLGFGDCAIAATTASDHRPVAATIVLP